MRERWMLDWLLVALLAITVGVVAPPVTAQAPDEEATEETEEPTEEELVDQVTITVIHELAHHFGIDDDTLWSIIRDDVPELLPSRKGNRIETEGSEGALKKLLAGKADIAALWEPDVSRALAAQGC